MYFSKVIYAVLLVNILSFLIEAQSNRENWAPEAKAAIDDLISKNSGKENAYVVFDWDNTSIFGDVQETLFIYQIENLLFKMTPDQFLYSFTHYTDTCCEDNLTVPKNNFTDEYTDVHGNAINIDLMASDCVNDYRYFYNNYRKMNPGSENDLTLEEIKKSKKYLDFRAKIWFTYGAIYSSFSANTAYTWVMYVTLPGFTEEELQKTVVEAINWAKNRKAKKLFRDSPEGFSGAAGRVSNTSVGNYFINTVRPLKEVSGLFNRFMQNNIDVYICSASHQDIVEVFATDKMFGYNLPQGHVLGMRLQKDEEGRYLSHYDFSDNYTINSMDGKTHNINKVLVTKYNTNPIMIAGDSSGDYDMITSFTGLNNERIVNELKPTQLILVINRLKEGKIGKICKLHMVNLTTYL